MTIQIQQPDPELYPDLDLEDILATLIQNKWLENDRELFETKWWDYRFMSPFEATMAYIDAFGEESRVLYARDIDYERAQHIRVKTGEKVKQGLLNNDDKARKQFAAFWRGRQVADALGIPYNVYCREAMSSRLKAWQRTYMPSPNHVYRDRDVERVAARWEEMQQSRIYYADHHAYLSQNFVGAPIQRAYCDYLICHANRTNDPEARMAEMVDADRLPLEYLIEHLPSEALERVRKSLR